MVNGRLTEESISLSFLTGQVQKKGVGIPVCSLHDILGSAKRSIIQQTFTFSEPLKSTENTTVLESQTSNLFKYVCTLPFC